METKTASYKLRQTNRYGNTLQVGDKVEFLNEGQYASKFWTIYRLTEKRVLCERKNQARRRIANSEMCKRFLSELSC